jgi:hypothetical protein
MKSQVMRKVTLENIKGDEAVNPAAIDIERALTIIDFLFLDREDSLPS